VWQVMARPHDDTAVTSRGIASSRGVPVIVRLGRVVLVMAAVVGAAVGVVAAGLTPLPSLHGGTRLGVADASAAVRPSPADKQWAASTCSNLLEWKNEIRRDGTSLNLGFGAVARVQDAIAATKRMVAQEDRLGLPPGAQGRQAQVDAGRLRAEVQARLSDLQSAAGSVAGGNLAAIGTLIADLKNDQGLGTQLSDQLRHVVSADLGLSLVETGACRQLVGSPV
jgi:hypothetical protein